MSFRSPWRHRPYLALVELGRRLLRPLGLEPALLRALVADQNRRVRRHLRGRPPASILLILPRCLKAPDCRIDVRSSLKDCRGCDRCQVGELVRLAEALGARPLVAFRSHVARQIARRERPDLVLATACEDRLLKALRGVPEIPALLRPLTGLQGTCRGATADLGWLRRELQAACASGRRQGHDLRTPGAGSRVARSAGP